MRLFTDGVGVGIWEVGAFDGDAVTGDFDVGADEGDAETGWTVPGCAVTYNYDRISDITGLGQI